MTQERPGTTDYKSFTANPMAIFDLVSEVKPNTAIPTASADLLIAEWVVGAIGAVVDAVETDNVLDSIARESSGEAIRVSVGAHSYFVTQRDSADGFSAFEVRQEGIKAPMSFAVRFEVNGFEWTNVATATFSAVVLDPRGRVRHREVVFGSEDKKLVVKYFYDGLAEEDPPREYRKYEETVA